MQIRVKGHEELVSRVNANGYRATVVSAAEVVKCSGLNIDAAV